MQIISYATQGVTNGWLNYEIRQHSFMSEPDVFKTGWVGDMSVVIIDYPLAAYKLQKEFYGKTNIDLDEDRITAFELL